MCTYTCAAYVLRLSHKLVSIGIEMIRRLAKHLQMKPVIPAKAGIQRR
jgi:hypothetical protein